jgi:hypothetical protein
VASIHPSAPHCARSAFVVTRQLGCQGLPHLWIHALSSRGKHRYLSGVADLQLLLITVTASRNGTSGSTHCTQSTKRRAGIHGTQLRRGIHGSRSQFHSSKRLKPLPQAQSYPAGGVVATWTPCSGEHTCSYVRADEPFDCCRKQSKARPEVAMQLLLRGGRSMSRLPTARKPHASRRLEGKQRHRAAVAAHPHASLQWASGIHASLSATTLAG